MDITNIIIIVLIIAAVSGVVLYYVKKLSKIEEDIEYDSIYSIKYLVDGVNQVFGDTQKTNLYEQNLSKNELEAEQRKKIEFRSNKKSASYGDGNSEKFMISLIREILQSKKFHINENTIELVIPFSHPSALDMRSINEIMYYWYYKKYGEPGFMKLMSDYKLNAKKELTEEQINDGELEYEVTEAEMKAAFNDFYPKINLSYEDKLNILATRVFEDCSGLSVIVPLIRFSLDEIQGGVSGVPKDSYEQKKEYMSKNFEYSYHSIYIVLSGVKIKMSNMSFGSQDELVRVCKNIYKYDTPYALSRNKAHVTSAMKDYSRISVSCAPESLGWQFFLRKYDSTPSLEPERLITDEHSEIPLNIIRWLTKALINLVISGGMGSGKTTLLKSIVRYFPTFKSIGTYEIKPELNLQSIYPKRNVISFSETENVSLKELYAFGRKTTRDISIIGESANSEMGCLFIESCINGSEVGITTSHETTAQNVVISYRDHLTNVGGYNDEKVAEEVVVNCVHFDIHMKIEKDHRYIERITEIIPIRDRSYPADKTGEFSDADTLEYMRRSTDRLSFTTQDIVRFIDGRYEFIHPISDEMQLMIRNKLSDEAEELFIKDMQILENSIEKSEKGA